MHFKASSKGEYKGSKAEVLSCGATCASLSIIKAVAGLYGAENSVET